MQRAGYPACHRPKFTVSFGYESSLATRSLRRTEGDGMRSTVLLAVVLFGALVPATPSAAAQEAAGNVALPEGSAPALNEGSLYSGPYEVTEDGDLIYGGDAVYRCEDLGRFGAPTTSGSEDATLRGVPMEPLTSEAVELCDEAGFPPSQDEAATTGAPPQYDGRTPAPVLPTTGGPGLLLPTTAVALLGLTCVLAVLVPRESAKAARRP